MALKESQEKMGVILFADLINSATLADILSIEEYVKIINQFHGEAKESYKDIFGKYPAEGLNDNKIYSSVGDEIMLIITYDNSNNKYENFENNDDDKNAILDILRFSRLIKTRWHLISYNQERIKQGKRPLEVGIGINIGSGNVDKKRSSGNFLGYAVVLAKRIESNSREGSYSKIMLSRYAYQKALDADAHVSFNFINQENLKGLLEKEPICEIKSFLGYSYWDQIKPLWDNPQKFFNIYKFDTFNIWLGIEIAIALYYRCAFSEALEILKKVEAAAPNSTICFMLQAECYFNLSINKLKEDKTHVFQNVTINYYHKALQIENNSKILIQLGLAHLALSIILSNEENTSTRESHYEKALEYLEKANDFSTNSTRALFWIVVLKKMINKDFEIKNFLFNSGWTDTKIISDKELLDFCEKHVLFYEKITFLKNYKANVYFCFGLIYAAILKTSKNDSLFWFDKAIDLAKDIIDNSPENPTYIYSSTLLMSYLQDPSQFIDYVQKIRKYVNDSFDDDDFDLFKIISDFGLIKKMLYSEHDYN